MIGVSTNKLPVLSLKTKADAKCLEITQVNIRHRSHGMGLQHGHNLKEQRIMSMFIHR